MHNISLTPSFIDMFPCLSSRNSCSFLILKDFGRYFSIIAFLKLAQLISTSLTVIRRWAPSHQSYVAPLNQLVASMTLSAYEHSANRKIFSICLIHLFASCGSTSPLNSEGWFLSYYLNVVFGWKDWPFCIILAHCPWDWACWLIFHCICIICMIFWCCKAYWACCS